MPLPSGTKLGPYEIQSLIGAGGMGEVYRAHDTRLGRDVALKILPEFLARDQERLHRFAQETRVVASLNHPNIVAIYDVGQHNGVPFLVSELLEGESLRAALEHGSLSQRKIIEYSTQITQGLAAAHEKGIVHRDLKPENLFIVRDGRAKILDFGLAKLAETQAAEVDPNAATLTHSPTALGVVMGTAGYMAPEQVRGQAIDPRTDIFAFGAVLYELLTGVRAFRRETTAETMTAVLKDDPPPFADSGHGVAPALDRIVRRCLEKDPEQRFQSAKDLSFALNVLSGSDSSGAARALEAAPGPWRFWMWSAAACALLIALGGGWFFTHRSSPEPRLQFSISVPGDASQQTLSSDGRMLAFVSPDDRTGVPMLFVQRVGSAGAVELSGTEGASYPFWSPDAAFVGFFAGGKLQKIGARGGAPQTLAKVSYPRGGSWGAKDVIVYAPHPGGPLWRVNADGTGNEVLSEATMTQSEASQRWPFFLPDGDHLLFLAANFGNPDDPSTTTICLTSLSDKGRKMQLLSAKSNPQFAAGHLFYVDDKKSLRAAALDVSGGKLSGESRIVVDTVGYQPSIFRGAFAVAAEGTLAYSASAAAARSQFTWVDKYGREMSHVGLPGVQANPAISPEGERLAADITDLAANNLDIWIFELGKGTSTRFTFDPAEETTPVWSHDGKTIAYRGIAGGGGISIKKASGLEPEKNIIHLNRSTTVLNVPGGYDLIPNSWSPDDRQILCSLQIAAGNGPGSALVLVPLDGSAPKRFLPARGSETNGQISPDGKWAAYASNESGTWEIYVTTYPGAVGKWQVSRGGGTEPRWRGDTKELYYLNPTGMLMSVQVEGGALFSSGVPAALFQVRGRAAISSTDLYSYDVTKNGERFIVNEYLKPDVVTPLTLLLHALNEPPM